MEWSPVPPDPTTKAAFLDKDGTIIENIPYNVDVTRIHLLEGVAEGLGRLSQSGFRLVVISNQAGIAKGYFPEDALEPVVERLRLLFENAGVELAGFYYCPHHPDGVAPEFRKSCDCRKPEPGMLLRAARELAVDLKSSWMIGDTAADVEAGRRAGCRTALISTLETESGATLAGASFLDVAGAIASIETS